MIRRSVVVRNTTGLHARPAHKLVSATRRYKSRVTLLRGSDVIGAASILEIITANIGFGEELVLQAEGPDARDAITEIGQLFAEGFGE